MTTYYATISHHSIARAPQITINGTLQQAKRAASREFGAGFIDHHIIISDDDDRIVASRRVGDKRWEEA